MSVQKGQKAGIKLFVNDCGLDERKIILNVSNFSISFWKWYKTIQTWV